MAWRALTTEEADEYRAKAMLLNGEYMPMSHTIRTEGHMKSGHRWHWHWHVDADTLEPVTDRKVVARMDMSYGIARLKAKMVDYDPNS